MRFDYTSTPAHPRKIYKIMTNFVNDISDLTREIELYRMNEEDEAAYTSATTQERRKMWPDIYRRLEPCFGEEKCVFTVKKEEVSCAHLKFAADNIDCHIGVNFNELATTANKAVRENAISRSKTLKGFSDATFTLLHELGHFMTQMDTEIIRLTNDEWEDIFEEAEKNSRNELEEQRIIQSYYCALPQEKAATDWAIDFLSDPENRKKAKAFEKEFFKAWRGSTTR